MPRTKKNRLIQRAPNYSGFKPFGLQKASLCEVKLNFEEYEAMKLCDYDNMKHEEAAEMMKISRPTFTRIYQSARRKLAKALVEAAIICIEGGKVIFDVAWFQCTACQISFSIIDGNELKCPFCGTVNITENK